MERPTGVEPASRGGAACSALELWPLVLALLLSSSTVIGQSKIDFGTQVKGSAKSIKYASDFRWTQTPSGALDVGQNTITLSPCPQGFFIPGNIQYTPTHYVYIAGTGTPEAALATRVSGFAGDPSCQINVTVVNQHPAGYTVGSASGGIKEASEAARSVVGRNNEFSGGLVILDAAGSPFNIYAPLHFEASYQTVMQAGGREECYVSSLNGWKDDDCIVVGLRTSQNKTTGVELDGLVIHAANGNPVNFAFDAIHVNAQRTLIKRPALIFSATNSGQSGVPIGSFNSLVSVCDDESFSLEGLGQGTASIGLRTDRRGQLIYALAEGDPRNTNNCFAVGWLKNIYASMQCGANGITWLSGNGLHVTDSVVQGFAQYGIRTGNPTGGFNGNTQIDNTYFEVGSCSGTNGNPDYLAAGATGTSARAQAGVLTQGGQVNGRGSTGFTGSMPTFTCVGTNGPTQFNYWVIATQAGASQGNGSSAPLYAGNTTCSGTVSGFFPAIPSAVNGTITYTVVRNSGAGINIFAPNTDGCSGGAVNACGTVISNKPQGGAAIETFTDDTTASTSSFTLPLIAFVPYLPFWPGNLILSASQPTNRTQVPVSTFTGEQNLGGGNGIGIVSVNGNYSPSLFMGTGTLSALGGTSVQLGGFNTATLLMRAQQANPDTANTKGRLNFIGTNLTGLSAGSIITLVDSKPDKTTSTSTYRPQMDATDVWIGSDQTGIAAINSIPLAFGSPTSVSMYLSSLPDGSSWKFRLSSGGLATVGGSANRAACWKADGKTLGFCSTTPDSQGACTCN